MAYGFKASEFLKASDLPPLGPTKEEYDPFFTSLNGKWGWDTVYSQSTASKEEEEASSVTNTVLGVFLGAAMLAPFAVLLNAVLHK